MFINCDMKKKTLLSLIVLSCFCLVVGCFSVSIAESVTVSFEVDSYSVPIGKSITLKTIVSPKSNMKMEWFSSNDEVATVSVKGVVKGISVGEAVITVKSIDNNEISASCKIFVVNPVKKIVLSDKSISLARGTIWRISAEVEPEDATNKNIVWSSSNNKVAMVSAGGVVTAISKGSAKITATAVDGSKATATVNVKVDEYNVVITSPLQQQAYYGYSGHGPIRIKGKVKNGNVAISGEEINGWFSGSKSDEHFTVIPIKAGTDTITLSGSFKVSFKVFVHPDAFKFQDLGFGNGAILENREYGVFNGHTYRIVKEKTTWLEAKEKCEQAGGHLATITTTEEQMFVELLNYQNTPLWFGLYKNSGNDWEWVIQESVEYTHWASGEPNDYATREFPFENVGVMRPEWNDLHENNKNEIGGYLCEWDDITVDVEYVVEEGTIADSEGIGVLNNHTYQIFKEKCSWTEAKEKCEAAGGHLVTITSPDEQRFVDRLNKGNKQYWMGLYKGGNGNGEWGWITGEPFNYSYWASGEPNDYFTREFPFENAGVVGKGWNDCHENNNADIEGYICEWDEDINGLANKVERTNEVDSIAYSQGCQFMGLSWGSPYDRVVNILSNKGIKLGDLQEEDSTYTADIDLFNNDITIGGQEPLYIGLNFTPDYGCKLYRVESIVYLLLEWDILDMKEKMIGEYGTPIKDEITGSWDFGEWRKGKECVWEQNGNTITLITTEDSGRVNVIYYNPTVNEQN